MSISKNDFVLDLNSLQKADLVKSPDFLNRN